MLDNNINWGSKQNEPQPRKLVGFGCGNLNLFAVESALESLCIRDLFPFVVRIMLRSVFKPRYFVLKPVAVGMLKACSDIVLWPEIRSFNSNIL